ncbi:hypothetical protein PVAND_015698 [Polypedilum vanderplanki]|uniref:Uncharacterized protein n=1 Tax=Polypedilum vanderplanki TaxID=319348 RepID=A0A9J6BDM5_POLVA|nr:hypothetical protein PVAND_015698 [Polypedilum vanderplanki]
MFRKILNFLIVIYSINFIFAQAPYKYKCPTFEKCTDKNFIFDQETILGYYYPILKIPYYFENGYKCSIFEFSKLPNKTIQFDKYDLNEKTKRERQMYGIFQSSPNGTLSLKFTQFEFPMTFKIVTNKPEYFIALACHDCGIFSQGGKGIYGYAFSKVPWPSCELIKEMKRKMINCGIGKHFIKHEIQDGCSRCS